MNSQPYVFIVDDDYAVRDSLRQVMETAGIICQIFESAEHFLQTYSGKPGCLLLDLNMPNMNGDELQAELIRRNIHLPIIFLTAYGDIPTTVRTIKLGAVDFLTKPVSSKLLIERIKSALRQAPQHSQETNQVICKRLDELTTREMEVMALVVAGRSNKEIARQLEISHRTVEIHRAQVMKKTGVANVLELARLYDTCLLPPQTAV